MTKKFTTPCFIMNNTPGLRKKLRKLGYKVLPNFADFPCLSARDGLVIPTDLFNRNGGFNCGSDESLFLAIAALRDDTDRHQWFCDDEGRWEKSEDDLPSKYMQMNGHKATVEELVEHFYNVPGFRQTFIYKF